jgi:NAD(P)-dependent dehydrogenase (short-subunit alcohol dehydrogenase family)
MRLQGKVAIVTGGGAGMGRAVAEGYAREGAAVVIAEVDARRGAETVEAILSFGGDALYAPTDVSERRDVEALVQAAIDRFGRIDVLYNNAGVQMIGHDARAHELSDEVWERTIAVNLRGPWLTSRCVIPHMLRQGGGSIIHVGSPTGWLGCAPGYTAYSASKGGLLGLTRIMAVDYGRDNIRVNLLVPGTTETPLIQDVLAQAGTRQRLAAAIPLGRIGAPEDVVGLAIFLASDEARFCTGGVFMVDGGMSAM